ncbi:peptidylprolyl isomerase [Candidatus Margulisiibacteriota bacterium]
MGKGVYAFFKTNHGEIICQLYPDRTPLTVANFINLATGRQPYVDLKTNQTVSGNNFYDGLIFHRIIPNFMVQGGDPLGTGRGGPGYRFKDEFHPSLKFDRPGKLAMANSGPNTNGSQFFITHRPTPWLNNKHTIFGHVVYGMNVVNALGRVPKDRNNKPLKDVVLEYVHILRVKD